MSVVAVFTTPILPLFRENRLGPINNNNGVGVEPRLIPKLKYFDTLDNSLYGDDSWKEKHPDHSYWSMVQWLYRNSLYGFKWTFLSAPVNVNQITFTGNPNINKNNGQCGIFTAKMGKYWEVKIVKKIIGDYGIMFDFGWLLNTYCDNPKAAITTPNALFQFSPRIVRIKNA